MFGSSQVDVWSLGVLAFELLTAELPFHGASLAVTLENIIRNHVIFPPYVSPLACEFMSLCLQSSPSRRPSVDELQQHPWIRGNYGEM
jgi:serine/threonine-protein kinase ULK2